MATEEEVAAAQKEVAKLRAQLQGLRLGDNNLQEASNEIALTALAAEAVNLQAQITAAKEARKKTAVEAGASAPLEAAKAELSQAIHSAEGKEPSKAAVRRATHEGSDN